MAQESQHVSHAQPSGSSSTRAPDATDVGGDASAGITAAPPADAEAASTQARPTRQRRSSKRHTPAEAAPTTSDTMPPARRTTPRGRLRESHIQGLGERTRLQAQFIAESRPLLPVADPLVVLLPALRQAFLNRPLDEALRITAEGLVASLPPAAAQMWITDPASWNAESARSGGQELLPLLRLRASAIATHDALTPADAAPSATQPTATQPQSVLRATPLVDAVVSSRSSVVLFECAEHPLATDWVPLFALPRATAEVPPDAAAGPAGSAMAQVDTPVGIQLGTLVAHPLRARGQLLGVLALGARQRLTARQLAAVAELADLAALAADRDRLLSYSRSQEALAQTVVRHAPVAIAVLTGPEHVFALTNPTFRALLGIESEMNLTGQTLRDVVQERAANLTSALRLDAVSSGGESQAMIELPIQHRERGITYWNVTSSPLLDRSSSVDGVLVAAVDVTRQVSARLRAQEVAEVAQERIGQMMTLHATSLAVSSQLGADPRELLADILRRSIALLDARAGTVYARNSQRDELEVVVCQGLRGDYTGSRIRIGEGLAGRTAFTGKGMLVDDYRAYPFRAAIYDDEDFSAVIAVPLVHRGQVVGVLDVLDDAERRTFVDDDLWLLDLFAAQAAQAIENARTYIELERAFRKQRALDHLKDDFIATASHELRTPLTGVQGFIDLLLEFPGSRDEPLALDFLRRAAESAQELGEISERLLQTSRLDTGRTELHLGSVRLATAVEETLSSFRALEQAQGRAHEFVMQVAPDLVVQADLGRLKEVLENLIGNAIKYSPQGGRIVVACAEHALPPASPTADGVPHGNDVAPLDTITERPTVTPPLLAEQGEDPAHDPCAPSPAVLAAAREQPYAVITVSDTGIGIPLEERSRLFGRFARLDSARVHQIRGTGLGLYICRQTLRVMAGDIWLRESTPGAGSTFAFALPAASDMPAMVAPDAVGSQSQHAPTI